MSNMSREAEPELHADAGGSEQRAAPRVALLIRSAKLICDHGEFLCIIRDVSQTGARLRLFHPIPKSNSLELILANEDRFAVEPVWESDGLAGFSFRDPVDLQRILSEECPFPKRPVRLNMCASATISCADRSGTATIRNFSREGMQIETDFPLAIAQKLRVSCDELPDLHAIVRWRRAPQFGLVLPHVLSFEELAVTAARLQLPPGTCGPVARNHGAAGRL